MADKSLLLIVLCLSFLSTYLYKKFAIRYGILANPNYRTLHQYPLPKGAGIIFGVLFVCSVLFLFSSQRLPEYMFYVLVGGLFVSLLGFADDIVGISAIIKLVAQIIFSIWAIYWFQNGFLFESIWIHKLILLPFISLFLVWVMNAYNFMDGVDAMAASGAILITITIWVALLLTGGAINVRLIFLLLAVSVGGIMVFNWPPASIFMGDAGSLFIGYNLGVLFLFTVMNDALTVWTWVSASAYFIADTSLTLITRIILVDKWYFAHRSHAYQNLVTITGSHLKITSGFILYQFVWVLPLTCWSALVPEIGVIAAGFSLLPAVVISYKYGPKYSSS